MVTMIEQPPAHAHEFSTGSRDAAEKPGAQLTNSAIVDAALAGAL
jgi:hypothetical protein